MKLKIGLPTGGLLVPLSRQSEDPPEKPTQWRAGSERTRAITPNVFKSRILCIWKGKSRKGRPLRAYHISFSPFSLLFWTPLSSYLIEKCSPLSLPSCLCLPVLFYSFSGIPIWLFVILSHFLSLVFLVCYNGIPSYLMCTDSYFLCCASTNSVCTHLCLFILYL